MSAALLARGAGEILHMRDDAANRRLEELLSALRHYQAELEDAKREGLRFAAERAQEEIRRRQDMIRRHCAATALVVPREVEEDGLTEDVQAKLRVLLDKLAHYRRELEFARERGDAHVIASAELMISSQQLIISAHCRRWKLPLPADVPEED